MSKTNIRINNAFLCYEDEKYYLSKITNIDEWNKTSSDDLKDNLKEVTEEVTKLMEEFNESSNVNFFIDKGLTGGG